MISGVMGAKGEGASSGELSGLVSGGDGGFGGGDIATDPRRCSARERCIKSESYLNYQNLGNFARRWTRKPHGKTNTARRRRVAGPFAGLGISAVGGADILVCLRPWQTRMSVPRLRGSRAFLLRGNASDSPS